MSKAAVQVTPVAISSNVQNANMVVVVVDYDVGVAVDN